MCFNQRFKSLAIHFHEMKKEIDAFISVKCQLSICIPSKLFKKGGHPLDFSHKLDYYLAIFKVKQIIGIFSL